MRHLRPLILSCIVLFSALGKAQPFDLNLTVIDPLPRLDFGAFIIANNITGAPTIFRVDITKPPAARVFISGELYWVDVNNSDQGVLSSFTTKLITVNSFTNNDLGNAIRLESHNENETLIRKNLAKGKPTGVYTLTLRLHAKLPRPLGDIDTLVDTEIRELSFTNPSQTLAIILPQQGMQLDPGNVVAIWNTITGAEKYRILANVRRFPSQSLEDALNSGNPIINNREVLATTVNLRTLLDREWTAGQEIVLQVKAIIPGVGSEPIFSQPISFYLTNQNNSGNPPSGGSGGVGNFSVVPLTPTQVIQIGTILSSQPGIAALLPQAMLQGLASGNLVLNLRNGDGTPITAQQVQQLLTYLQQNPGQLLNVLFRRTN